MGIHLRKERLHSKRKCKVMPRTDGPFLILGRVNDNAYKVNFLGEYRVSATLNVADLSCYLEDDHLANLRENSPQQGEDDGGPSMEPHQEPQGSPRSLIPSSKVKERVQVLIDQLAVLSGSTSMHKPDFVNLLEGDPGGIISSTPHPHLA